MNKTKILFVCKHNMFRSKIAEIYFKKINRNKDIVATSAGLIRGYSPLEKREVIIAKEFGINLRGKPRGLSVDLVRKQNLIIIVANDVPNIFNNKSYIDFKKTKVIVWKIPDDPGAKNLDKLRRIIKSIMKKIEELNNNLQRKEKWNR